MLQLLLAASVMAAPQSAATVTIDQFAFKPAIVTVTAGQTVRFVNRDQEAHTATQRGGGFDSGGLDTGASWTHQFTKAGKFVYFCELHPYMTATIIVLPAGSAK